MFAGRWRTDTVRVVPRRRPEAGSEAGASAGKGLEERESGMAVGTLCDGGVARGEGLPGDTELGHEGLAEEGMRGNDPVISGEGGAAVMAWRRCAMTAAERT